MDLERDPELTALVEEAAREHNTPGVAAGVLIEGRALVATVGVTSTANPLPVDEDTAFLIGSTSKTLTATAVMAVVEAGGLALTDRVIDHLPDLQLADGEVAQSVTIRHLLNHTSGWRGDAHPATGWGDDALARSLERLPETPQLVPLGELASYSNSGFLLAGHLLATVRGTTYEQAVRELVLEPLELAATWGFPWEVAHRRHAVGHIIRDGEPEPVLVYPLFRTIGPAGGWWSTVRDQLAYAGYHLDGTTSGTAPLSETTRLLMQEQTVEMRSGLDGVGISWLLNHHGDARLLTHGGNVSNLQTSTFVLAPDQGVALTVMANTKHAPAISERVQAWALERVGVGPKPTLATQPCVVDELVGTYDVGPWRWSMTEQDGRIRIGIVVPEGTPEEVRIAFAAPPQELVAVGEDVFALASDPKAPVLDVRRAPDGTVAGIVHGLRYAPRVADGERTG